MIKRRPTGAELDILQVLWTKGPSTVRDVHEELNSARPTGYTTVLKLMQIMAEKGLVARDEKQRAHIYEAKVRKDQTQTAMVSDLMERMFNGSAARLVMHALSGKKASKEELDEIRRTLDDMEGRSR